MLNRLLRSLRNFYVATGLGLLVWMLFFDANDLISQFRHWRELRELEEQQGYYQQKVREVQAQQRQVLGSKQLREKFAREKYLMKRPSEDVYVIVDEHNEPLEK